MLLDYSGVIDPHNALNTMCSLSVGIVYISIRIPRSSEVNLFQSVHLEEQTKEVRSPT